VFGSRKLVERIETLERGLASLKLEWEETLDKLTRRMRSMRQAAEYLQEREEAAAEPSPALAGSGGGEPTHGFLTPRQKAIQQQILRYRAGRGGNSE
jgi:DNA repair exonuclease SbcCD ATPase subunit